MTIGRAGSMRCAKDCKSLLESSHLGAKSPFYGSFANRTVARGAAFPVVNGHLRPVLAITAHSALTVRKRPFRLLEDSVASLAQV